jgi:DNA polymerase-4
LDADAFYASVEQAADSRLRGKAMAVGGENRGVISSASYEARARGVKSAMSTTQAKRLCPSLILVPGDFEKYERFSRLMFAYAYDLTPDVEVCSIDEGYLDLSKQGHGHPRDSAMHLSKVIRENLKITISQGLASNKFCSAVASKLKKPNNFIEVPAGTEREFLAPLPSRWLPGIGKKTAERLLLELKGKMGTDLGLPAGTSHDHANDILQALVALGYSDKEAALALKSLPPDIGVSDGIKMALKALAK